MSGPFPPGGPPFPPPYNYGGQYVPQFQGNPSFNNGMMPQQQQPPPLHQQPLHQAPFQQHRPPPFHSPMPPNPNQVHFANTNNFHHNAQFSQPSYFQGPMQHQPPPPQYYNYGPYNNNMPGPAYTPLPPNAAFNATPSVPMNQFSHPNLPHNGTVVTHIPSSTNTPVRPVFSSQHASGSEDFFVQREPSGAIHDNLASVTQLPDDTRDYDPEDLITVSHAQEDEKGTITGPSPDLIEIDFREEAVQAADSPRQPSPPNEPVTLPSQNPNEVMQDALRDQEDNGPIVSQLSPSQTSPTEAQQDIVMSDAAEEVISLQPLHPNPAKEHVGKEKESFRLHRRAQARQALTELHNQKIGFKALSLEEVDPGLMEQLYEEAGLSYSCENSEAAKDRIATQRTDLISVKIRDTPATEKQQNQSSQPYSPPETTPQKPHEVQAQASSQSSQQPNSVGLPPHALESQRKLTPITAKNPTAPVNGDRKDYVARLLAAKAGIKADSRDRPKEDAANSVSRDLSPQNDVKTPQATTQKATTKEHKRSETKDSKQTELIRQRLEALKKNTKSQQGALSQSLVEPVKAPSVVAQPSEKMEIDQTTPSPPIEVAANDGSGLQRLYDSSVSFFAPSTRTLSGSLPGLPGLSNFPLPSDPPPPTEKITRDPIMNNVSSYDTEEGEITSEDGEVPAHIVDQHTPQQPVPETEANKPIIQSDTVSESRKRPIAADFIDSPPAKAARHSTPSDTIPLVIEVSDNEEESPVLETQGQQQPQETVAQDSKSKSTNEKSNGTADDLSAPASSIKPSQQDINVSAKISRIHVPLAQHEEQIRIMRLKIAEAESRRKAKTPGTVAGASSPAPSPGGANLVLAKNVDAKQQAIKEVNEQLEEREKALASARREMQEKMDIERRNQAHIAALAEKERHEATIIATRKEWEARLSRRAALEAALSDLDVQINTARGKLEDMKKQQEDLQAEMERGNKGRQELLEELKGILDSLEADNIKSVSLQDQDDDVVVLEERKRESPQSRQSSIRSMSPVVTQLPKISIPDPPIAKLKGSTNTPQTARTEPTGETMDLASSSEDEGQIIGSTWSPTGISQGKPPVEVDEFRMPDDPQSEESKEEYEPAIARSDPEADQSQTVSRTPEDEIEYVGNEDYEPTLDVDIIPVDALSSSRSKSRMPSGPSEEPMSVVTSIHSSDEGNITQASNPTSGKPSISRSSVEEGEVHDTSEGSDNYEPPETSVPVESPKSKPPESRSASAHLPGLSQGPDAMDLDADIAKVAPPMVDADVDLLAASATEDQGEPSSQQEPVSLGRFKPYESPLRQFLSYRFHPKYVEEVPGGFQSLTFNHKIKPSETMCRWELAGGICNDSSCQYQHFRDLPLTDNNLLLQLGSVHEGTTQQEKEAYINGLKQMIAGMRDKNLRNVSQIASEISGYRSRFLADPTRILTNL